MRLLTPEAAKTRFDFEWTFDGGIPKIPLLAILEAERALKLALIEQFLPCSHGVLHGVLNG